MNFWEAVQAMKMGRTLSVAGSDWGYYFVVKKVEKNNAFYRSRVKGKNIEIQEIQDFPVVLIEDDSWEILDASKFKLGDLE